LRPHISNLHDMHTDAKRYTGTIVFLAKLVAYVLDGLHAGRLRGN
jgi:hypothetical protein